MAHPLRLRLVELLRGGPSTASRLARELGESSGATSYHLRVLARAGVVEDDPGHRGGRERWWRRKTDFLVVSFEPEDPEGRALEAELRADYAARDEEALLRFEAREPDLESAWRVAAYVGSWNLYLTLDEVNEFSDRVMALVREAVRSYDDRAPDSRRVLVTYRAIPWVE